MVTLGILVFMLFFVLKGIGFQISSESPNIEIIVVRFFNILLYLYPRHTKYAMGV